MEDVKVGDIVQWYVNGKVKDGTVVSIIPPQTPKPPNFRYYDYSGDDRKQFFTYAVITTGDTTVTMETHILDEVDNEFEREFRLNMEKASDLINEKLREANKSLSEAEAIAEEYGVPFSSNISPLGQDYTPSSMRGKYPELDADFMHEQAGTSNDCEYGWQHSAVCY